jgi:hypothetical protein
MKNEKHILMVFLEQHTNEVLAALTSALTAFNQSQLILIIRKEMYCFVKQWANFCIAWTYRKEWDQIITIIPRILLRISINVWYLAGTCKSVVDDGINYLFYMLIKQNCSINCMRMVHSSHAGLFAYFFRF